MVCAAAKPNEVLEFVGHLVVGWLALVEPIGCWSNQWFWLVRNRVGRRRARFGIHFRFWCGLVGQMVPAKTNQSGPEPACTEAQAGSLTSSGSIGIWYTSIPTPFQIAESQISRAGRVCAVNAILVSPPA
jgi:hypothetical protein